MPEQRSVVAIGIDAMEKELLQDLIAAGRLPNLARLLERGRWTEVESAASIGSGSVWPTFFTGLTPNEHGQYWEWCWVPAEMDVRRYSGEGLVPFWAKLVAEGYRVGVLDVPFAPLLGMEEGFEISEWGSHDVLSAKTEIAPTRARQIVSTARPHPYGHQPPKPGGPTDLSGLRSLAKDSVIGVESRGDLARRLVSDLAPHLTLIVFPEIHHAGHFLWHTVNPEHPSFTGENLALYNGGPTLVDICAHVDRELGRFVEDASDDTSFMVFALHGMKPGRGVPTILSALMTKDGYSRPPSRSSMTLQEKRAAVLGAIKAAAPVWMKDLYHRRADPMLQVKMARSTMLERHDWERTSAFALPADQHGWIRVNLKGREARGIVDIGDYQELCDRIEARIRSLRSKDGRLLVANVVRPAKDDIDPLLSQLPDIVAHWDLVAHELPLALEEPELATAHVAPHLTGQHTFNAFCITAGPISRDMPEMIWCGDLHRYLEDAVRQLPPQNK